MGIPRIGINEIGNQNIWTVGTQNIWDVKVAETYTNNIPNVYIPSWMVTQPGISIIGLPMLTTTGGSR